ncbi:MAG: magnesium transporter, partial [Desulfovibrio sp.]|nr:magnesium transporter [Desulfovibrio sp.]
VVSMFEGPIAQMAALALLRPLVANQAGNTGQQALAVMIRQMSRDRFEPRKAWTAVMREGKIGVATGVCMALISFLGAWVFTGNYLIGVVMGGAILCDMILGAVAGGSIPLVFRALGRDPAQASSIFLTTITDGAGFFIFLGLASWFLF